MEEAGKLVREGGLVGMGCEAHEDKVRARGERRQEKRVNRSEGRRMRNKRRKMGKEIRENGAHSSDEEAQFVAVVSG